MNKTNAIFDSDKFPIEWHPDGGDDNPPPGFDLAMSLFESLIDRGATYEEKFNLTMWEHGNWYFQVKLENVKLSFTIQPYDDSKIPHRWWIAVNISKIGLIKSFFGGEDIYLPPEKIISKIEEIIKDITNSSMLIWKSNDELDH